MKAGWEIKTLGEVCHFVRGPFGGSLKKSMFVESGIAVYEQQHAIYNQFDDIRYFVDDAKFEEMKRFELQPNDLIMSCSGTMGKVAIVPDNIQKGIINQALLKLTPSKSISSNFLSYWMTSPNFQNSLNEQSGGAAIQNVASVSILKEIKIKLPPLPEQKRLVTLLDEAFESIATAKANAQQNLKNARALFESHLNEVFTKRGEGWEEKTLGELGTITSSKRIFKSEYVDSGIPFFRTKEIKELANGQEISTELFISEERYKEIKTNFGVPKQGDILLTAIGTIGEIYVVKGENDFYFKDGNVLWLKEFNTINPNFLKYVLISFVESLNKMAHGSTYSALPIQRLNVHTVFVPSLHEQNEIVNQLDSLREETKRLEALYSRKISALDELKKALLHRAFAGEL